MIIAEEVVEIEFLGEAVLGLRLRMLKPRGCLGILRFDSSAAIVEVGEGTTQ